MENLVVSLIQMALQPFLQQFFNILIEIRDRLPERPVMVPGPPVDPVTLPNNVVQFPSKQEVVQEVPASVVPTTRVVSREEIGQLATQVATHPSIGVATAKEMITPFQKGPQVRADEPWPSIGNIDPSKYLALAILFEKALEAVK